LWTRNAVIILGEDEALKKKQGFRGRAIIGVSFAAVAALAVHLASKDAVTVDGFSHEDG
jgi:cardiolipin synthase